MRRRSSYTPEYSGGTLRPGGRHGCSPLRRCSGSCPTLYIPPRRRRESRSSLRTDIPRLRDFRDRGLPDRAKSTARLPNRSPNPGGRRRARSAVGHLRFKPQPEHQPLFVHLFGQPRKPRREFFFAYGKVAQSFRVVVAKPAVVYNQKLGADLLCAVGKIEDLLFVDLEPERFPGVQDDRAVRKRKGAGERSCAG